MTPRCCRLRAGIGTAGAGGAGSERARWGSRRRWGDRPHGGVAAIALNFRIFWSESSSPSGRAAFCHAAKSGRLACRLRNASNASIRRQSASATTTVRPCRFSIPAICVAALPDFGKSVVRTIATGISPARFSSSEICLPNATPRVLALHTATSSLSTPLSGL